MNLYLPNPRKRGQWWHYVAALKNEIGAEFGVQCTVFKFGEREFYHAAVTDVTAKRHVRKEHEMGAVNDFWPIVQNSEGRHTVRFNLPSARYATVDLDFLAPLATAQEYPSETSLHYGYPRMNVRGCIGDMKVSGVGCFDREVFDRLLDRKRGETGWTWCVAWFDDGGYEMTYLVHGEHPRWRIRTTQAGLEFDDGDIPQLWPKSIIMGYMEAFGTVKEIGFSKRVGRGFCEVVTGEKDKIEV